MLPSPAALVGKIILKGKWHSEAAGGSTASTYSTSTEADHHGDAAGGKVVNVKVRTKNRRAISASGVELDISD